MQRIIRLPEVMRNTGLKRSTIYKLMSMKNFPIQVSLGAQAVGWVETEIAGWIQDRIAESQSAINIIAQKEANLCKQTTVR